MELLLSSGLILQRETNMMGIQNKSGEQHLLSEWQFNHIIQ